MSKELSKLKQLWQDACHASESPDDPRSAETRLSLNCQIPMPLMETIMGSVRAGRLGLSDCSYLPAIVSTDDAKAGLAWGKRKANELSLPQRLIWVYSSDWLFDEGVPQKVILGQSFKRVASELGHELYIEEAKGTPISQVLEWIRATKRGESQPKQPAN